MDVSYINKMTPEQREERKREARRRWHANKWRYDHRLPIAPPAPVADAGPDPLDLKAEDVWARLADPHYYSPACERFRGFVPPRVNVNRVVTL